MILIVFRDDYLSVSGSEPIVLGKCCDQAHPPKEPIACLPLGMKSSGQPSHDVSVVTAGTPARLGRGEELPAFPVHAGARLERPGQEAVG